MTIPLLVLVAYAALSLAYWLVTAYALFRVRRAVPLLAGVQTPEPQHWPKLSVVVPACNEADRIEAAFQSLLDEDYPDVEFVLVDDRSTDGTSRLVDRFAARDGRVKAIHVTELPAGWLGKVHALDLGLKNCSGEFVLFTDADVHFKRGTLRKAAAYCLEQRLDHLAGLPQIWRSGLVLNSMVQVFFRQLVLATRLWAAGDPASPAFIGVGAFNLVRRAAFDATPGFEWLRLEIADDVGVGLMMKRSGARCGVVSAFGNVGLYWYRSIGEAARGAEKGYASALRFSMARALVAALLLPALEAAPVLLLLPLAWAPLRVVGYSGVAVLLAFLLSIVLLVRWTHGSLLPPLLGPFIVAPIFCAAIVRIAVLGRRRGGVLWRGTLYSEEMLRAGMRVRIP